MKTSKYIIALFTAVTCLAISQLALAIVIYPTEDQIDHNDNEIVAKNDSPYDISISVAGSDKVNVPSGQSKKIATISKNPAVAIYFHQLGKDQVTPNTSQFTFDTAGHPGSLYYSQKPLGFRIAGMQSKSNPSIFYEIQPTITTLLKQKSHNFYKKIFTIIIGNDVIKPKPSN